MKSKTKFSCIFAVLILAVLAWCLWDQSRPRETAAGSFATRWPIDDASLDQLVAEGASMSGLIQKYGEPLSVTYREGEQVAFFLVNVPDTIPPVPGRIGFTAVMKDGKIVEWAEATID